MPNPDLKYAIQDALLNFERQPLAEAAGVLLNTLGYRSDKTLRVSPNTAEGFQTMFDPHKQLKADARLDEWKSVDLLFQITGEEVGAALRGQESLFVNKEADTALIQSCLFFAVELKGAAYSRKDLAGITHAVNKLFPMPVMLVFKHGNAVSLAIIARRTSRRDASRDVLEKVTLIKDIACASPHRAHIEILFDLSAQELWRAYRFTNFSELQHAWEKTLDTSELNNKFFREYRRIFEEAEAVIPATLNWSGERKRLYTQRFFNRLLFIVFLERKGWLKFNGRRDYLRALFEDYVKNDPEKRREANFHRKRLNNLFFMGLNHPSGDKRQEAAYRPILGLIGDIPFLNGGLFDEEEDDRDGPLFPDPIIATILNELVYRFVASASRNSCARSGSSLPSPRAAIRWRVRGRWGRRSSHGV